MTHVLKKFKSKNPRENKTLRMSDQELAEAQVKADVYAEGKLSAWIRYASTHCIPYKDDMEKKKK